MSLRKQGASHYVSHNSGNKMKIPQLTKPTELYHLVGLYKFIIPRGCNQTNLSQAQFLSYHYQFHPCHVYIKR